METTVKNLASKMVKVVGSVSGKVTKSGYNSHNKYAYIMEKDLLDAVREELTTNNVLITSSVESVSREGDITTVRMKHVLVDADSGESMEVWSAGQGADKQDKGIFKAITGANKYFLMKTFLLSGNDDPEADEQPKTVANKTPTEVKATPSKLAFTNKVIKKEDIDLVEPVKPKFTGFNKTLTKEKPEF